MEEKLSERQTPAMVGPQGRKARRKRTKDLISIVTGNRGWRTAFIKEYPAFDSYQGTIEISRGQQGTSDDPVLLEALEFWIPKIVSETPDWYVKRKHLTSNISP